MSFSQKLLIDSIKQVVWSFFEPFSIRDDDGIRFFYLSENNHLETEYLNESGNKVPSTRAIWLAGTGLPSQVRHLFLSNSAVELICFCHFCPDWLRNENAVVFAALGLMPTFHQLLCLKESYPNAKVHTVFDTEITGRVTDCKIALWRTRLDAAFLYRENVLKIYNKERYFDIPGDQFSLFRFEQITGLRSGIRTHKPTGAFSSYKHLLFNL